MGNLKTAALACGVVAAVLGGGAGVAYLTSSTISTADLVTEEVEVNNYDRDDTSTAATAGEALTAIANKGTTTKKSNKADNTSATSKKTSSAQEGTTSQYSTAADKAAKISRSVPARAHAPALITETSTEAATTATIIATAADAIREATTATIAEISSTTTQAATTQETTTTVTTTVAETTAETTTTVVETVTEAPEVTTETYVEPQTEPTSTDVESTEFQLPISDEEYILLCNAVAHEAGSDTISNYNKAYVVEVIMNRKDSPIFPNTIYDVLTQNGQFTGCWSYVNLGTFSYKVTQSVKDSVTLYFTEPDSFTQGYLFFTGNGRENIFRTSY
ncbi:MAG: cell wall hydrolase [Ruminococcus sp.]|uniref:cell wall hydrolase n=1 Tax=Ruminococcus sp. TaxID=41978 RepID=UPI0025DE775C|nr:cell wall hydrolase [Ruminococcus sp.]MBR5683711.1 cell wall hydrolase [Ruminococcus sp.]